MRSADELTDEIEDRERMVISDTESVTFDGRSGGQALSLLLLHGRSSTRMLAHDSLSRLRASRAQGEGHEQGKIP